MKNNTQCISIKWGDCDPAGIVFFPRYFEMFNFCTSTLFETAMECTEPELFATCGIVGYPVVNIEADFKGSCTFGDVVTILTSMEHMGTSSFQVKHKLFNSDVLCVEGLEVRVWAGRDEKNKGRLISKPIEESVRVGLS